MEDLFKKLQTAVVLSFPHLPNYEVTNWYRVKFIYWQELYQKALL